jgi:hypothetical protein
MSEKCLKMTHFDIKFEQIQGFFADGILTNFVAIGARKAKQLFFQNNLNNFLFLFQNFQDCSRLFKDFSRLFKDYSRFFKSFSRLLKTNFVARRGAMKAKQLFFLQNNLNDFYFFFKTSRLFKTIQKTFHKNLFTKCHFQTQSFQN